MPANLVSNANLQEHTGLEFADASMVGPSPHAHGVARVVSLPPRICLAASLGTATNRSGLHTRVDTRMSRMNTRTRIAATHMYCSHDCIQAHVLQPRMYTDTRIVSMHDHRSYCWFVRGLWQATTAGTLGCLTFDFSHMSAVLLAPGSGFVRGHTVGR